MNQIEELHSQAMEAADQALLARRRADEAGAEASFAKAYEWESQAARLAVEENVPEPSRSVLLRSAATLALDAGKTREAERLAAMGLVGDPPPEIADELRAILEKCISLSGIK
ncbi:MAG: hypothetical protein ACLFV4_06715 [Candidatus Hydrogenedentota bacterium]